MLLLFVVTHIILPQREWNKSGRWAIFENKYKKSNF